MFCFGGGPGSGGSDPSLADGRRLRMAGGAPGPPWLMRRYFSSEPFHRASKCLGDGQGSQRGCSAPGPQANAAFSIRYAEKIHLYRTGSARPDTNDNAELIAATLSEIQPDA